MDPLSAWWRVASPWPDLPPFYTGQVHASDIADAGINDLVGGLISSVRGQSYLAWHEYQIAAELHARLVGDSDRADDLLLKDGFADCAARVSLSLCVGQGRPRNCCTAPWRCAIASLRWPSG
ncbi:hypothetical protein AAFP30_12975 [Gordonia sp. CPCC 205515]|uniref:hypothetical protein n=1 Tax=Gordonia sp. CPCC 205515 TaxID=3140791 RepID=UPI003AF3A56B